jgi:hypothetical protein
MAQRWMVAVLLAGWLAAPTAAGAAGGFAWMVGLGRFGLRGQDEQHSVVFDGEVRFPPGKFRIFPLVGVLGNEDGAVYVRGGLGRDFPLGRHWVGTLTSAVGAYSEGDSKDLGSVVEFHSKGELGYRVGPGMRLGIALAHISNAGLAKPNPGVETLTVNLTFRPGAGRGGRSGGD